MRSFSRPAGTDSKIDKEYVREWFAAQDSAASNPPAMPDEVGLERPPVHSGVWGLITGSEFTANDRPPLEHVRANLIQAGCLPGRC